ncbi:hypothetical protein AVEN_149176-1 [Araneus ventricosus]|uniref:Uncharacterized protein n=1 Tax=Araneus ventricosus TaxID=182803 RepID=A0A4Y2TFI1_ARAVE|nr:hypothetical protein AVEN_149176-1 [Araneus ventricosus]
MSNNVSNPQDVYLNNQGNRSYPKTNDNEYYMKFNGEDVILETTQGERYAKDSKGDEIYPKDQNNNDKYIDQIYAMNATGELIFPKNEDGEFYLTDDKGSSVLRSRNVQLHRYAKNSNNDEIYPIILNKVLNSSKEDVLKNEYAKLSNNKEYYPIDEYGNEYILVVKNIGVHQVIDEKKSFPDSYPITNDNYIIVPKIDSKPYFLTNSGVAQENILGELYREISSYYDFVTNVLSNRKSRSSKKMYKYQTLDTKQVITVHSQSSGKGNSNWSITFLILMLLTMIIPIGYGIFRKFK